MIDIEIDGQKVSVPEGTKIIEVADLLGINIPRFCYHKKLSIAANCRMCLVEVKNCPKPMPACSTPVCHGMKIDTQSTLTRVAQQSVMEFLLINHPLDCPICDQGGECELQDVALCYGKSQGQYSEGKRSVKDQNIGPLIATEMTRCIYCTRCVRFGSEIAGIRELGVLGRNEQVQVSTFLNYSVDSELSGNVIDLCPVGALTSKPFRFKARAWECQTRRSISMHDCIGCNLYLNTYHGKVLRVIPRANDALNEVWLSDRDRFSYEGVNAEDRLMAPIVKEAGAWKTVDWPLALEQVAQKISSLIDQKGPQSLGILGSPQATVEEAYLLQKLFRAKGCHNLDHRLRALDVKDQAFAPDFPQLGKDLVALENTPKILVIGSYLRKDQPILNHRLRQATLKGNEVAFVNPFGFKNNFELKHNVIGEKGDLIEPLVGIIKAFNQPVSLSLEPLLKDCHPTVAEKNLAEWLVQGPCVHILLGSLALGNEAASLIRFLAASITEMCQGTWGEISNGPNMAGCHIAGLLPHRGPLGQGQPDIPGLSVVEMFRKKLPGYFLYNFEPEFDCAEGNTAIEALKEAETVILLTSYVTPKMLEYADILLPIALGPENEGTFVNGVNHWQSFRQAMHPKGEAKCGWKVLRVLGNYLKIDRFDYENVEEILIELKRYWEQDNKPLAQKRYTPTELPAKKKNPIARLAPVGLYRIDAIVRRAKSLQETQDGKNANGAFLNKETAREWGLKEGMAVKLKTKQGTYSHPVPLILDNLIPKTVVVLSAGIEATSHLNDNDEIVSIESAEEKVKTDNRNLNDE
ncbi:MAG TPA: NADH-quinone oxidoreductase subunit NuoG [Gammaproteobacteria bacterium]|nr:NADH-quinone oxidoreductase subunit NuoG [Gammaproteobacteria bacterium]